MFELSYDFFRFCSRVGKSISEMWSAWLAEEVVSIAPASAEEGSYLRLVCVREHLTKVKVFRYREWSVFNCVYINSHS